MVTTIGMAVGAVVAETAVTKNSMRLSPARAGPPVHSPWSLPVPHLVAAHCAAPPRTCTHSPARLAAQPRRDESTSQEKKGGGKFGIPEGFWAAKHCYSNSQASL